MQKFIERTRARQRPLSPELWTDYDERFYNLAPVSKLLSASRKWTVVDRASVRNDLAEFTAGFHLIASQAGDLLREACKATFAENPAARRYFTNNYQAYLRAARPMQLGKFIRGLREADA
jgi:hypothetical protein